MDMAINYINCLFGFKLLSKSLMTIDEEKNSGMKTGKKPLKDNLHKIRQKVFIVHQPIQC
ncbi:hypothetical protein UP17_16490 [Peribacillus simplex]|nr:hypothetical protein UP17_16490 [Peribacillus simplex]